MPNKPRPENPARPVRMDDKLWAEVRALAERLGVTPSEVVRRAAWAFINWNQLR